MIRFPVQIGVFQAFDLSFGTRHVLETVEKLTAALEPDYVVIGGGEARKLAELPPNARLGENDEAFLGGFRLWEDSAPAR